jgi:hypothetical protein
LRVSLEHPYLSVYLDGQLQAQRGRRRRIRTQGYRMARKVSWVERIVGVALLVGAACSLLLALLMAAGLIWLIGLLVQELVRWWRG